MPVASQFTVSEKVDTRAEKSSGIQTESLRVSVCGEGLSSQRPAEVVLDEWDGGRSPKRGDMTTTHKRRIEEIGVSCVCQCRYKSQTNTRARSKANLIFTWRTSFAMWVGDHPGRSTTEGQNLSFLSPTARQYIPVQRLRLRKLVPAGQDGKWWVPHSRPSFGLEWGFSFLQVGCRGYTRKPPLKLRLNGAPVLGFLRLG